MSLYMNLGGKAVAWRGEAIDDVRYPLSIAVLWSDAELAAIGLFKPLPADPVPAGKVSAGTTVELVNGQPKSVHQLEDIVITSEDVNEERRRRLDEGYVFTLTDYATPVALRGRQEDQSTLMGLFMEAQLRVGAGDTTSLTKFRDRDNVDHLLTPPQVIELWQLGASWMSMIYQRSWDLKDMAPIPLDYTDSLYWS